MLGAGIILNAMYHQILLSDQRTVVLRRATPDDSEGIYQLYQRVYGGSYTLSVVNLVAERRAHLNDPNCWWLLNVIDDQIIGSVIFVLDNEQRVGKVFGAAVLPEFQGHHLMYYTIGAGIDRLLHEDRLVDVIYATTRSESMGPASLLRKLGFVSLGIFPNVHRLAEYETHGLRAIYHPDAFSQRRGTPHLIPEVAGFYDIVRKGFGLEAPDIIHVEGRVDLTHVRGEDVLKLYNEALAAGRLLLSYFPFHTPNFLFQSADGKIRAFVNHDGKDGYGVLVGLQTERDEILYLTQVFDVVFETGRGIGIEYMEILLPAYEPRFQQAALAAKFLPCAYFPAIERLGSERLDHIIFARTNLPLNFSRVQMTPRDRQFLDVYLSNTEFRNLVVRMHATGPLDDESVY